MQFTASSLILKEGKNRIVKSRVSQNIFQLIALQCSQSLTVIGAVCMTAEPK